MSKNVQEFEIKLNKEWEDAIDKTFKKKNKETKIDGFRKGCAPKEVFIKKVGIESLYMDAVDSVVNIAYKKVLKDNKELIPVIEPKVDIVNINEKEITIKFTIITKPEIKLGAYTNLKVKKEKVEVTAEQVDAEVKAIQEKNADLATKKSGKVEKGNTAIIDFKGYVDGELLEGGTGENYSLEIGSNSFIPGFEDGLVGKKVGEEVTLNLKFPEEYTENLKGKDVKFDVKINEVKERIVPEINEDFFKDLGYKDVKTIDDLKKKIKKELTEEKTHQAEDEYTEKCLEKALENMEIDLNEEIIEDEVHAMMHETDNNLKRQGFSLDQYMQMLGMSHEDLHKQMEPEAEKRVKTRFLIEEIIDKENIDFTEDEVKEEAEKMAKNYGITVDEMIKAYGTIDIVKYDMKAHKAIEIIKENK